MDVPISGFYLIVTDNLLSSKAQNSLSWHYNLAYSNYAQIKIENLEIWVYIRQKIALGAFPADYRMGSIIIKMFFFVKLYHDFLNDGVVFFYLK